MAFRSRVLALVLCGSFGLVTTASAADTAVSAASEALATAQKAAAAAPKLSASPLPAAGAAGVKEAQRLEDVPWVFYAGGALLALAVVVGLTHHESKEPSATTE